MTIIIITIFILRETVPSQQRCSSSMKYYLIDRELSGDRRTRNDFTSQTGDDQGRCHCYGNIVITILIKQNYYSLVNSDIFNFIIIFLYFTKKKQCLDYKGHWFHYYFISAGFSASLILW